MTTANHNSQRSAASSAHKALVALLGFALVVQPAYAGTLVFKHNVPGFQGAPVPWTNDGSSNPPPPPPPPPETQQPAALQFTSPQVDFGQVTVGQNRQASVVLRNTGGLPATGVTVSVPAGSFSASSNCSTTLAAGAQCTVQVEFTASTVGSQSATVSATASGTQASLPVSAQVMAAPAASLQAAPASLSFATTATGQTTVASVVITNSGNASAQTAISVAAGASDFSQTNDCATVAAGASCTVDVTFAPASAGQKTGAVAVTYGSQMLVVGLDGSAQAPSASLTSIDFGDQAVSSSSQRTATLTNTGVGPLSVTPPTAGSVTGAGFSFDSTTCGTSLPAGASCSVTVNFSPTFGGGYSGSLSLTTAAGGKTATLSGQGLQGTGIANPTSLTFATTQVGQTAAVQSVTVTNSGNSPLNISGVSVATGASDFAQSNDCGTSLPNGSSCTINVAFTPATTGTRVGSLAMTHDGDGGITLVSLTGTGQAPSASLSGISFGSHATGAPTALTSTLTNTGVGPLTLAVPSAASVTGTGFSFQSTTCGTSLAVGASCTVTVSFAPDSNSAFSGTLTVTTEAGSKAANLTGQGLQGIAVASPASLSFAAIQFGQTSDSQSVTVTNSGTAALSISGVSVSTGASDFAQSNNCGASLAVGSSCTVTVAFTPALAGTRSGTLSIAHNGAGNVTNVSLVGDAQNPRATMTSPVFPPSMTAGVATATLTNTGIGPLNITLPAVIRTGSASQFTYNAAATTCGQGLPVGASCQIGVQFNPGLQSTVRTGYLDVTTSAGVISAALSAQRGTLTFSISPSSLAFGNQETNTTSAAQTVTVTNTGNVSGTVSVPLTNFVLSNNCAPSVAPGASCTLDIAFRPTVAGTLTETPNVNFRWVDYSVNVSTNKVLTLTGNGVAPAQALNAVIATNDLNGVTVGTTSTGEAWVRFENLGAESVEYQGVTAQAPLFVSDAFCSPGDWLATGENCTVILKVTPTSAGSFTRNVTVQTNKGSVSIAVPFTAQ